MGFKNGMENILCNYINIIEKRKAYKYLYVIIDIFKVIKIIFGDLYWKGKLLVFTWHFKEEFDTLRKPLEFVLDILDGGEHILVSKNQNKYNVFYPFHGKCFCLSYVEHENVILIHIKPASKKMEAKGK